MSAHHADMRTKLGQHLAASATLTHIEDSSSRVRLLAPCAIAAGSALGLLTVAAADTLARSGSSWAEPLFWAGMLLLWVPSTVRLIGRSATRGERITLLLLLGMAMYVVHLLYSPRYFSDYDELLHWRTAQDILRTGAVPTTNPGLPVSPLYPGLELATAATAQLTGLSVVVAGRIVVGAAHLIVILALYLLYERAGRSSWLAGIATAIYCTNPEFLFVDGLFAYESVAIALAFLALYTVQRGIDTASGPRLRMTLLVMLPLAATVVTHHATSVVLVLGLILLATFAMVSARADTRIWLWAVALIGLGFVVLWTALVADQVIGYLKPYVVGGIGELGRLLGGEGGSRHLFHSYVGRATPAVYQAGSFAFAAITILALPLGCLQIWRTRRCEPMILLFASCLITYPLSGLFHFTAIGAQVGQRLPATLFVAVAFCIAMAVAAIPPSRFTTPCTMTLVLIGAVLLYGGITAGSPFWLRLPGPYLVSANDRSIEPQGISAGTWARQFLPDNSRVGADRINGVLMLAYGHQWPVGLQGGRNDLAPVFFARRLTASDLRLLRSASVRYLLVDHRLARSLPVEGFYYNQDEPGVGVHRRPVPIAAFEKFDRLGAVSRVFDSGDIAIFDISDLVRNE